MSAAVPPFFRTSERDFRTIGGGCVVVRVQSVAAGATKTRPGLIHRGQNPNSSARKVIIGGVRLNYRIPPSVSSAGNSADEASAYCCNLVGLFIGQGASTDLMNFCRSLTGWSVRAPLNSSQEPSCRVCNWFRSFPGSVLGHAEKYTEEPRRLFWPLYWSGRIAIEVTK